MNVSAVSYSLALLLLVAPLATAGAGPYVTLLSAHPGCLLLSAGAAHFTASFVMRRLLELVFRVPGAATRAAAAGAQRWGA